MFTELHKNLRNLLVKENMQRFAAKDRLLLFSLQQNFYIYYYVMLLLFTIFYFMKGKKSDDYKWTVAYWEFYR